MNSARSSFDSGLFQFDLCEKKLYCKIFVEPRENMNFAGRYMAVVSMIVPMVVSISIGNG